MPYFVNIKYLLFKKTGQDLNTDAITSIGLNINIITSKGLNIDKVITSIAVTSIGYTIDKATALVNTYIAFWSWFYTLTLLMIDTAFDDK